MSVEQLYDISILSCFLPECFNNDTSEKKPVFCSGLIYHRPAVKKRRQVNVILTRAEM